MLNMSKSIGLRYKTAREHLKLNKNVLKKRINVDYTTINRIENDKADSPNWKYTKYLVEQGINYFYLIGVSDQIEGQVIDHSREEHEAVLNRLAELETAHQELQGKYNYLVEFVQLLKIEVDENGNVMQKPKK